MRQVLLALGVYLMATAIMEQSASLAMGPRARQVATLGARPAVYPWAWPVNFKSDFLMRQWLYIRAPPGLCMPVGRAGIRRVKCESELIFASMNLFICPIRATHGQWAAPAAEHAPTAASDAANAADSRASCEHRGSFQRRLFGAAGTLLLVAAIALVPWGSGGLWAVPASEHAPAATPAAGEAADEEATPAHEERQAPAEGEAERPLLTDAADGCLDSADAHAKVQALVVHVSPKLWLG